MKMQSSDHSQMGRNVHTLLALGLLYNMQKNNYEVFCYYIASLELEILCLMLDLLTASLSNKKLSQENTNKSKIQKIT